MTQVSTDPVGGAPTVGAPTVEPPSEALAPVKAKARMPRWQSFLIAFGSLVAVYGLATLVMLGGGAVVHALKPTRHVDIFAALHNAWVVGVLLGITVLWLLPPHPWAKRVVVPRSQEQPAENAGGTEDGGWGAFTVQEEIPGSGPVPRPAED
jgi:hypothetical protein